MAEGSVDKEFLKIDQNWTGFMIWRIVNFELEPWTDIGAFYTGDSYLMIHGYTKGTSKRILWDIYFWLGSESTTDETGTAAYKATHLDDYLGGSPIQHREVQYHETDAFRKLFEPYGGIRYMDGGADSGFTRVENDETIVMYQVKGARKPILQRVKPTGESLNHGDVFIIHKKGNFWLWIGKKANRFEKMKAVSVLDNLRSNDPKAKVERLEDSDTSASFWEVLGGETPIADAEEGGSDKEFELSMKQTIVRIEGENFVECPFKRESLTSDGLYLVQCGKALVCYIGSACSISGEAMTKALKYIESSELPAWCPVTIAREGCACEDLDLAFA